LKNDLEIKNFFEVEDYEFEIKVNYNENEEKFIQEIKNMKYLYEFKIQKFVKFEMKDI
jgi:hypothetical protein